jgi:putative hydrolase of the HAD superfamily
MLFQILPKAVVFDLDDTLYLERDFVQSGFTEVGEWCRAHLGISDFMNRARSDFQAGGRKKIFNRVLASYGFSSDDALVLQLVAVYRDHIPSITLLDDARICLDALYGRYPLALITDGFSKTQWQKIRALGVEDRFEAIIITGELGPAFVKPHPLAFNSVADRLGLTGDQLAYVGDNASKDFIAPYQLGWQTVCVTRSHGICFGIPLGSDVRYRVKNLLDLVQRFQVPVPTAK